MSAQRPGTLPPMIEIVPADAIVHVLREAARAAINAGAPRSAIAPMLAAGNGAAEDYVARVERAPFDVLTGNLERVRPDHVLRDIVRDVSHELERRAAGQVAV
jgi:hypothetical protein